MWCRRVSIVPGKPPSETLVVIREWPSARQHYLGDGSCSKQRSRVPNKDLALQGDVFDETTAESGNDPRPGRPVQSETVLGPLRSRAGTCGSSLREVVS